MDREDISKELLSEVLGYEISSVGEVDYQDDLCYTLKDGDKETMNIYGLLRKCRKWATTKGYVVISSCEADWVYANSYVVHKSRINHKLFELNDGETEIEVVSKACEWILKRVTND